MRTKISDFDEELLNMFKEKYTNFLIDNEGYKDILSYIEGKYNGKKYRWAKYAKKAGLKLVRKGDEYFIKS